MHVDASIGADSSARGARGIPIGWRALLQRRTLLLKANVDAEAVRHPPAIPATFQMTQAFQLVSLLFRISLRRGSPYSFAQKVAKNWKFELMILSVSRWFGFESRLHINYKLSTMYFAVEAANS